MPVIPPVSPTPPTPPTQGTTPAQTTTGGGETFAQMLSQAIGQVAQAQANAQNLQAQFAVGGNVSVEEVMAATAQAALLTETAASIATRALSAYQSLMDTNIG